jgi:hypothetical protein
MKEGPKGYYEKKMKNFHALKSSQKGWSLDSFYAGQGRQIKHF